MPAANTGQSSGQRRGDAAGGAPGGGRNIGTVPGQQRDRGYDSAPAGGLPRGVCGAGSLGGTVQDVPWVLPFRIEAPPPPATGRGGVPSHIGRVHVPVGHSAVRLRNIAVG